jgi:hypothetical protein
MKHKAEHDQPLQGLRILVADDEFLIAIAIEETRTEPLRAYSLSCPSSCPSSCPDPLLMEVTV